MFQLFYKLCFMSYKSYTDLFAIFCKNVDFNADKSSQSKPNFTVILWSGGVCAQKCTKEV